MLTADTALPPYCQDAGEDQLVGEILHRLRSAYYHVLRDIECAYVDGAVVLRGRVPTYYLKQLAQSLLPDHPSINEVVNLIEVTPYPGDGSRFT